MAKQKQNENPEHQPRTRSFKSDTSAFVTIQVGEQVEGVFLGARTQTINDRKTKKEKDLWVIRLRKDTGEVIKLPCAALMLQAWSDIVDEYGDGDENATIEALRGKTMQITRGQDMQTKDQNRMGTYEFTIFD